MKASFIINPNSGPKSIIRELDEIIELLSKNGIEVEKNISESSEEAEKLTKKAVDENLDLVIAAGGDGTINAVCNSLVNTKIPLGIIPTGTANVLAKELGVPTRKLLNSEYIKNSAKLILEKNITTIDLGKVTLENDVSRYFTMWCGIGLDALLTEAKKTPPDNNFGRFFNYLRWIFSILKLTTTYKGLELKYKIDDNFFQEKIFQMLISNGNIYANFFKISKSAGFDDGILELVILRDKNKITLTYHLLLSTLNRKLKSDLNTQIKKISITSEKSLPLHLDAETYFSKQVEIDIVPKSLKIFVPSGN